MSEPLKGLRMLYLVGEPGGAERVDIADLFAERLAGMGLEIDYVLFSGEPGPFWVEQEWRGARAFVTGFSRASGLTARVLNKLIEFSVDLRTFLQALSEPYDIVQVRDKFVIAVLGLLAARLKGKRFCYWYSYPFAEGRILDGREGISAYPRLSIVGGTIAKWLLYRVIMPGADHVFVQSQQMLEDIAAEGIAPEKMTPVPMGVSEELLETAPAPVDANTFLYLGTMARIRRLDVLLSALSIIRRTNDKARLIMVGAGPDAADLEYMQSFAAELELDDHVDFTGMLPMTEAHARVQRAAVCVSPFYPTPILQSTSPTKISEYMALGRPVVANSHPEQSVILAESGAGLCVEWSAEEFAAAIGELLADPVKAEEMASRGRDYVRRNRIYPVIAPICADQYQKFVEGSDD